MIFNVAELIAWLSRFYHLAPGDLLINAASNNAGHVVIFDYWVDATMTSYVGYEQSGDGGTHHRVIPWPYFDNYVLHSYRWIG